MFVFLWARDCSTTSPQKKQCVLKLKTLCPDLKLLDIEDVRRWQAFWGSFARFRVCVSTSAHLVYYKVTMISEFDIRYVQVSVMTSFINANTTFLG